MLYELGTPRISRGLTDDGPTAILEQDFVMLEESDDPIATLRVRVTDGPDDYVTMFGRLIMHKRLQALVEQTADWGSFTPGDLDEILPAE